MIAKNGCANPKQEILDSEWHLYKKLRPIHIYTCKITKTVDYCDNRTSRSFTYFDISTNCKSENKQESPVAVVKEYGCQRRNILKIKVNKNVQVYKGDVCLEADELFLPSGRTCKYSLGFCYNSDVGYVWDTKIEEVVSCTNFAHIDMRDSTVVGLSLDEEYLIFETQDEAVAVELAKEFDLCGRRVWSNKKGLFVTNGTAFEIEWGTFNIRTYVNVQKKQRLYESLIENCERNRKVDLLFYYYATVALLVYVGFHFILSLYNHLTNCRTFNRVKVGTCQWLFQSWINRVFVNRSTVNETILRSDIEMIRADSRPSYYKFCSPTNNPDLTASATRC